MRLTILGCSGSLGAPGNPGSSYLISSPERPDAPGVVMDFGPGALAALQSVHDPANAHVIFSHLHADHCSDLPSLLVWRRFHPTAPSPRRHVLAGPSYAAEHFGRMSADGPADIDDISDTFDVRPWQSWSPLELEGLEITPIPVLHPAAESHALRVVCSHTGRVLAFSGDSGMTPSLLDVARDADLFLCEAAWGPSSEGKAPGMHLSGQEAGWLAREAGVDTLVLVHIQPWTDPEETAAAARREFDGPVVVGRPGDVFDL
ncbi:MBL fold metallo-hydrolase [Corynebacterium timonense]|uniref:Ribonuclease BN, tRNA processing enzyme n=1 Tax=Corynebacterium timonense TaxID=441500 RepID=A0A1H1LI05_9CORY|nr:MBL fold metallo-hydrolase [Corynebacterium timonense]SDR74146.1 Ribonuclease BN, tRNA processing enzyme [Corynebacterium timonense]